MSLTTEFINRVMSRPPRIAVVGDAMIDEYYEVEATRISPEFPIPVMRSLDDTPTTCLPGGSANVAYQFKHWNTHPVLHALLDEEASLCLDKSIRVNAGCIQLDKIGGMIPRKRRIYDGNHPAFRWDIEKPYCGLGNNLGKYQIYLYDLFCRLTTQLFHAVILSDYNKGTFATHTDLGIDARKQWISPNYISVVDPKTSPIEGWANCTIFKPNAKEARELSGKNDRYDQCQYFLDQLNCQHVVITHGGDGVVGMSKDKSSFALDNKWDIDAKSVIGAGDCFIAFLTMAYSVGFNIFDSSTIAYQAGACYVQGNRNKPITPHELLAMEDPIEAKYLPPPGKNNRDFDLGFTNGCFDLFHSGHLASLQFAKSQCDKLVVAVNDDESVRSLKGSHRPYVPLKDRMRIIASLDCVDFVVSFSDPSPLAIIKEYRPDVLIKGGEYQDKAIVGSEYAGNIALCPMVEGFSTSSLEKIIWASANSVQEADAS